METQDSIDIARVQRDALGRAEHEPTQSSIFRPSKLNGSAQNHSTNSNNYTIPSYGAGSSIVDRSQLETLPDATRASDPPPLNQQNETSLMNSTGSENNKTTSVSKPSSAMTDPATVIPSDTQVVSQSVYDSIIQKNGESIYGLSQTGADGATLMTLHEGDSGHIDLLAGFDTLRHETNISPEQDEDSNYDPAESSPVAYQPELFPESQRFLTTTPGTAVKKNHTPGTSTETPSVSRNPLAGDIESSGGLMGLSQLFKATQAPSSPLVQGLQPDIVSDRPSPNIPIQQARIANNPSSPLVHFARESSEPNLNYISMKESQSRRDKSLGERLIRSADDIHSDDPIDQEFNKEPSFVENARRQRELDEENLALFFATGPSPSNAPSRSKNRGSFSEFVEYNWAAPDPKLKGAPPPDPVNGHNENAGAGSEEETEQEDDTAPQVPRSQEVPHSSEEDKENFNGPASPVIGASSAHDRLSQALAMDSEPSSRNDGVPQSEPRVTQTGSIELHDQNHHHDQPSTRSSQVMVMDSQQSPLSSPRPANREIIHQPQPSEMELDPVPDPNPDNVENEHKSPARQHSEKSTSPSRLADQQLDSNANSHQHDEVIQNTSSNEMNRPYSSNSHEPRMNGSFANGSQIGNKSSMPSRINETPVHPRPALDDMGRLTSVPETSPNRTENNDWEAQSNGDGENNEDDDLPPMFPIGSARRISQVRGSQSRALSSPIKSLQTQAQAQVLSSPSGRQRRALTEIASDCSPQVDFRLGDISLDFFTAEDEQFNSLIADGSPTRPRKRRRGNVGQSLNTSDTADLPTPRAQPPKTTEPIRESSSQQMSGTPGNEPATPRAQPSKTIAPNQESPVQQLSEPPSHEPTTPRAQPSNTLEPIRESPVQQMSVTPDYQPATAIRKRGRPPRQNKSVWEIETSPRQPIMRRRPKHNRLAAPRVREERPVELEKQDSLNSSQVSVVIDNSQKVKSSQQTQLSEFIDRDSGEEDRLLSDINAARSPSTTPLPCPAPSEKVKVAPSQVLAVWQGQKRAYYPGTCLGVPPGNPDTKYSVKFEDSAPVEVIKSAVKRLELRVGDGVKVEMRGVPKVTHIIRGFDDKLTKEDISRAAANGYYPQTDIYGYSSLILGPKQRKSLPNGGFSSLDHVIKVPMSQVYLDTILWNQLQDRQFLYQSEPAPQTAPSHSHTHTHTPSEKSSLPGSPSARLPRSTQSAGGVFANMAFAVSYKEDETSKNRISKLILDNGGKILHEGFTELFEPASILPFDTPPRLHGKMNAGSTGLRLATFAENIGFACLIADTHSRREKYMQALALGLPCLSGRWIEDCVAHGCVIDWDIYLLPAGDSTYLNGATKSRMMIPSPSSEAHLTETIAARPKLLTGKSVLIVTGRGKSEEKRKAYIFLTFALGASRVERVPDIETARALVEYQTQASLPCKWDLVYVDDSDQLSAKAMLTPKTRRVSKVHSKKRKFDMSSPVDGSAPIATVVGNEFFCQSLILGKLVAA